MTSLGTKEVPFRPEEGGVYSFRIKGALHHRHGPMVASQGKAPKFAQIYIHDPHDMDRQLSNRMNVFGDNGLDAQILGLLQEILQQHNPLVQIYKQAGEVLLAETDKPVTLQLRMLDTANKDPRTYNAPTVDEIGILIVGMEEEEYQPRDIVLHHRSLNPDNNYRGLKYIDELSSLYLPLRYVLILPHGEFGWSTNIPFRGNQEALRADREEYGVARDSIALAQERQRNPVVGKGGTRHVTLSMFHSYYLFNRPGVRSLLLRSGRLFQEWVVDAAAAIEQNRLKWITENQTKLRAEEYSSLKAAISENDELDPSNVGTLVVLPSSFAGSPRQMQGLYQDAMAIVRYFGKPDLFITMTCNPKWPEIQQNLFESQIASDRPDLVTRVFDLKLQALQDDIRKHKIFGSVSACIYVMEYQKRGLPHAHMLFILDKSERTSTLRTGDDVDSIVKAEFPNPDTDPELWSTVTTCMLHGPCNKEFSSAPCLKDGRGIAGSCSKRYPKDFRETTSMGNEGYPEYRRRKDDIEAFTFTKRLRQSDGKQVEFKYTNEWVVPYNPYLSKKFNCHINVEICSSIKAIKYLYKYVYKGPDRANVGINEQDPNRLNEPKQYLDARYLSPPESCARILGIKMHDGDPSVQRLALHLEDQQQVYYDPETLEDANGILDSQKARRTTLTAWFEANRVYEDACDLLYVDFPTKFVWKDKEREWKPRQRKFAIGRIYFCGPKAGERYYLRLLLHHVTGPKSWEDLKSVPGHQQPFRTFREVCLARGLLESDQQWHTCLTEAASMMKGSGMRDLFCVILTESDPGNPRELWEDHKEDLCDDCTHILREKYGILAPSTEQVFSLGLCYIRQTLEGLRSDLDSVGLPQPAHEFELNSECGGNRFIQEQLSFNMANLEQRVQTNRPLLNDCQRAAYDAILLALDGGGGGLFFLDGPGGTGKTFVENLLLATVRSQGHVALAVASSGIAALLLEGGRTAHSMFSIPIPVENNSVCPVEKEGTKADLFRQTKLIIWDEASMQHRYAYEAVDRMLQDVRNDARPFGGITVLFAGDFRQCLPVVPNGSRGQIIAATLKKSLLWEKIHRFKLEENVRLMSGNMMESERQRAADYARYILRIGDDIERSERPDHISLLPSMRLATNTIEALVEHVYPGLENGHLPTPEFLAERAILAARNVDVDDLNNNLLDLLPGDEHTYKSIDSVSTEDNHTYGEEYLNSLQINGVPPHRLCLKIGAPIMLLRNINPLQGLCNGTRLQITHLSSNVVGGKC